MNRNAVLTRKVELIYRQFPLLMVISMTTAMLFAVVIAHEVGQTVAVLWFGLATAAMVLRVVLYGQFKASPAREDEALRWTLHLFIGAATSGLVWGAAALFYLMIEDAPDRILIIAAVLGAAMTGANWYAAIPRASTAYVLSALAPFALAMFAEPGRGHVALGVIAILLMATLVAISLSLGKLIHEWCVQTARSSNLAKGLEAAYSQLMSEMQQRQQADEHSGETSRKLELLMRQTPLATIEWNQENQVTQWNPAAESMFGYSGAEVIGRSTVIDLIFAEARREQAAEQWQRVMAKREGFQVVTENIARGGLELTCSWAVTPLLDAEGKWIGTIAQARDITANSAEFKALKESQRQLEEAQQLAHVGHWEWDCASRRASFSREALRIFGKPEGWNPTPEELADLVTDANGNGILERVRRAGANQLDEFSIEHCVDDGKGCRQVHSRVRVEYGADGAVLRFIAATQDVTELRSYQQQLHSLAFFDTLTGLPNRALFSDRIGQTITESLWHKDLMGLMVLDLDHFQAINDTLGHALGDHLLREAATRLTECVRAYDTVARLGGDEFAILLPDIREGADLGNIARKIIEAFASPYHLEERELFVTCSIGIVLYPSDGSDANELLRFADSAMYHAKSLGRNNFQFYSAELTERSSARLSLDAHLRQAEKNGELELYYQPQIDLATGRLIGAEALLRWNHPERGLVMPDKFIGIAEDTGLIVPIGEWVLRTGCQTARRWNEHRVDGIVRVAVNLSPRQFRMNDLVGTIRSMLNETGCRPEWIECEITESLLLDDSDGIHGMLLEIAAMGVALSIDDFGTGYSSLGYLNRYPVESIKIDRSFVCNIMTEQDAAELVKAIISMACSLHLKLVAEGVETADQEKFLKSHRCHIGQGWLYGKAMPQAQFEALLPLAKLPQNELFSPLMYVDEPRLADVGA
ncbi:MAG: EAL domain-containing protein [Sulfuritalea sp.]|nr:EAL domain-containing protein [Sulfuritalea sp.]